MPLSIQHQADSAGDKAVSLIADNSGSNVAAAFKGVNKATQNGDTVADLVVSLDSETVALAIQKAEDAAHASGDSGIPVLVVRKDTAATLAGTDGDYTLLIVDANGRLHTLDNTGATDDSAAAGQIYPLAGLYQTPATVDEIDTGDVGRLRSTARRGLIASPDFRMVWGHNTDVASIGDVEVSTTAWNSGYAAPTTAFFNGADGGFGAGARWIRIPMVGWRHAAVRFFQSLAVNLTVSVYAWITGTSLTADSGSGSLFLDTATVTTSGQVFFSPFAAGAGAPASIRTVAALQLPMSYLVIELTPASDPSSGVIQFVCARG